MTRLPEVVSALLAMLSGACDRAPSSAEVQREDSKMLQTGVASFYSNEFAGRETASGEPLKLNAMTAASRTLPLGTRVKVVNAATGQSATVKVNDRGPYAKGRILDLTPRAARHVGIEKASGVAKVTLKPIQTKKLATPPPAAEIEAH